MYSKYEKKPSFVTTGESVGYVLECDNYKEEFYQGDQLSLSLIHIQMCIRDRVITGLLQADTGEVVFDGEMLYSKKKHLHRKQQCKQSQMVFQNPEGSLNPKHTIEKILSDAMLRCV